jgi:HK97 family phage portal protein
MATDLTLTPVTEIENRAETSRANPATVTWFPHSSEAGVAVTHGVAFMQAAVWACIDVISASLASSDWNVYSGVRGGDNKEVLPDDSLQYVLNTRFNDEMTAQSGKRALGIAAAGYGAGYAEIERDLSRRIVALWPIAPDRCYKIRNAEGRLVLRVTQDYAGGTIDLEMEDVFQIQGASLTGLAGDDMVAKAVSTIARSVAVDRFASSYFANGTQLGGTLEYPFALDDKQFERLQGQLNSKHQGARNAFKTLFLEAGGKFTQFKADAESSQLIEVKNQLIEEVCRWFRVPPHKIAHLLRATNNNIEHQGLEFSRDTLRPWKVEIEQECDYKLIPYRGPRKFIEIDVDWASEGDFKSRLEAFSTGINSGIYSPNQVLRKLGENTIGKAGNVHMVQGAMMKLEDVGKNMLPAAAPAAKPADSTPAAWLTSVYARIQRRYDNRAADLQRGGRAEWMAEAREATRGYAREQVNELADTLGDQIEAAQQWAQEVINGCEPKIAALSALESK